MLAAAVACTSPRSPFDRAERGLSPVRNAVDSGDGRDAATEPDSSSIATMRLDAAVSGTQDASLPIEPPPTEVMGPETEARCGDGRLSNEERCDTAIVAGEPGACPAQCPASAKPCERAVLRGDACDAHCETQRITAATPGDGCCPDGASAREDSDCSAHCGNGVIESGETCDPPESCPACAASSACVAATLQGSAASCTARCVTMPITGCASGDGCCPSGCTRASDSDCPSRCGDGVVDPQAGETCETSGPFACPVSCDDDNPCTLDIRGGRADSCDVLCLHTAITEPASGDGCCPTGASAREDSDCSGTPACVAGREQDACARCACDRCSNIALTCRPGTDSAQATRCDAVARCVVRNRCNELECYCGNNLAACLLGNPSGPCRAEMDAASNNLGALAIVDLLLDSSSPLGRGLLLSRCEAESCANECGSTR